MNFMDMMRRQDRSRTALIEDGTEYTYGELVAMGERAADRLTEQPAHSRIRYIRNDKISGQLTELLAANLCGDIPVIVPGDAKRLPKEQQVSEMPASYGDICLGVMTSGSTGQPKLLFRSYESWADFFDIQNDIFGIDADSRLFAQGSLAFTGNLNIYMSQFSVGAAIVAQNSFNPKSWGQTLKDYDVNSIYLIPSKLLCMPQVMREANSNIRSIISGSQSLGKSDAKRLAQCFPNAKLTLYYGASELSYITYVTGKQMTDKQDLVGKPFPNVQVEVRNHEIYVTTPYHVAGVTCPYTLSDCGYIDEDGSLHFTGRSDDIVNLRGRKISALYIEETLRAQPEIKDAAVLAVPVSRSTDAPENERHILTAFVVLEDGVSTPLQKLKGALQKRLADTLAPYEFPAHFVDIDALPQKESGKTDKNKLAEYITKTGGKL